MVKATRIVLAMTFESYGTMVWQLLHVVMLERTAMELLMDTKLSKEVR